MEFYRNWPSNFKPITSNTRKRLVLYIYLVFYSSFLVIHIYQILQKPPSVVDLRKIKIKCWSKLKIEIKGSFVYGQEDGSLSLKEQEHLISSFLAHARVLFCFVFLHVPYLSLYRISMSTKDRTQAVFLHLIFFLCQKV